ncbi:MAG: phosphatidylinositol kinase [Flavobacteriales bacterium]|nr:MAG: phosphatidylinositol kinase [Flavobacteriales bacterium]
MRKAEVYYRDELAGILTESDQKGYTFEYDRNYVEKYADQPITLTMKVRNTPYTKDVLFPFFEGLIPEGWLLNIASKNWKINKNDRMGLLLACCGNCIGAVGVKPVKEK